MERTLHELCVAHSLKNLIFNFGHSKGQWQKSFPSACIKMGLYVSEAILLNLF